MADLTIHDETNAPEAARPLLEKVKAAYGFIPSVLGIMAESPPTLEAYQSLQGHFAKAGFTPLEAQVVQITTSVENECHYCVAAHSAVADAGKLDMDVINAVRDNRPIADPKLEALHAFTRSVVRGRGFVCDAQVGAFLNAGYSRAAVLGVILGVAMKTISNYVNHVAETPLNPQFKAYAWSPRKQGDFAA